jgi:hypothetical protein
MRVVAGMDAPSEQRNDRAVTARDPRAFNYFYLAFRQFLVGHSYGGVVITEAGTHPRVTDLVFVVIGLANRQRHYGLGITATNTVFLDRDAFAASRLETWHFVKLPMRNYPRGWAKMPIEAITKITGTITRQ